LTREQARLTPERWRKGRRKGEGGNTCPSRLVTHAVDSLSRASASASSLPKRPTSAPPPPSTGTPSAAGRVRSAASASLAHAELQLRAAAVTAAATRPVQPLLHTTDKDAVMEIVWSWIPAAAAAAASRKAAATVFAHVSDSCASARMAEAAAWHPSSRPSSAAACAVAAGTVAATAAGALAMRRSASLRAPAGSRPRSASAGDGGGPMAAGNM
jgi:hypothetical protein